ncbi:MAG: hypothetical protein HZA07_01715 [Nitrospirae bacterium]|nr:hypothetical protein [Nitrospirota bacterium]
MDKEYFLEIVEGTIAYVYFKTESGDVEVSKMAKRAIKREEIIYYLLDEGFKEIKAAEKLAQWYKKASERPSCLKTIHKKRGAKNKLPVMSGY